VWYSPRDGDETNVDGDAGADRLAPLPPELLAVELPELDGLPAELGPESPPRETALPPVRSPDVLGSRVALPAPRLCALAGRTPAANTATNVPISNLPRVIGGILQDRN
jgi:hypothetical protein